MTPLIVGYRAIFLHDNVISLYFRRSQVDLELQLENSILIVVERKCYVKRYNFSRIIDVIFCSLLFEQEFAIMIDMCV